jgi:hypothetical protein
LKHKILRKPPNIALHCLVQVARRYAIKKREISIDKDFLASENFDGWDHTFDRDQHAINGFAHWLGLRFQIGISKIWLSKFKAMAFG